MYKPVAILDVTIPNYPRLVIDVPSEQQSAVQADLNALVQVGDGTVIQRILLDALLNAVEQTWFWTPEWQAKEREANQAIVEGRVRTFDTMEEMVEFLDAQ